MPNATIPLNKRPINHRPIGDFTIHPAIKDDERMGPKDSRYLRMQAAWEEQGGCPPIYATADGQIVDGRHRYWWMQKVEETEVPWIEVSEDEVPTIILGALQGRNNLTKGQQAFLAAPKIESALKAANARRVAILQSGGKVKLPVIPDAEALAERLGISRETLRQARKIHEYFGDKKHGARLRKEWTAKILDPEEPVNLGFALAGIAGSVSTKGAPKKPKRNSSLAKVCSSFKNMVQPFAKFSKWPEEEQARVVIAMDEAFAKLPDEALEKIASVLKAVKRRKTEAATQD